MEGTAGRHKALGRGSRDGPGTRGDGKKEKGIRMGTGIPCCSPSIPPHPTCTDRSSPAPAPSIPAPCPGQRRPGQRQSLGFGSSGSGGVGLEPRRDTQSSRSHPSPSHAGWAQRSRTRTHRRGAQLVPSPQRAELSTSDSHRSAGGTDRILC